MSYAIRDFFLMIKEEILTQPHRIYIQGLKIALRYLHFN
jgi:hypothetical protein